MAQPKTQTPQPELLVLDRAPAGVDKIPAGTPLTRLNYYDGLFLRASHLDAEQRYVRALAGFANQGLGPGLVHGFSTELEGTGDTLAVRAGLAFDAEGRTLFLPRDVKVNVQELIDKSRAAAAGGVVPGGLLVGGEFGDCTVAAVGGGTSAPVPEGSVYQVVICHLEALCGQEDVYGRLCEKACATDVERPWRVEGVVLRALPLPLTTPFPQSLSVSLGDERFLRSNVAHSFFEDERQRHPHLISATLLRSHAWCLGAGVDVRGCEVPLAVIARAGGKTLFLDPWIVRRERMETPSRRYWDWRMAMRPWDVFLAQVLQFQCQLADGPGDAPPDAEPCEVERQALDAGVKTLAETLTQIQAASPNQPPPFVKGLAELRDKFAELLKAQPGGGAAASGAHILIDRGFDELPPAGWLPVVKDKIVQGQVRALMGAGVDLRFCIVRPDYVGHALEEAQHLERISLTRGLDDPKQLEQVDILVPNGALFQTVPPPQVATGKLVGRVMDPRGGSQPGTTVTAQALQGGTPLQTVTDAKSNFAFDNLAPGAYQVSATVAGLGTASKPVAVVSNQTVSLDLIVGGPSVIVDPLPGAVTVPGAVAGTLEPLPWPILATLDWVFFHRRREKQCAGAPPPVKTRRYQVFHLADDFRVQDIVRAFAEPQSAAQLAARLKLVGPAEFTAGTAALVTAPAALLAAWQAAKPRNRVFSAVVATPGTDDDSIEMARLDAVFQVIEPVSSSAHAETGRMDDVPAVLGLSADEGFMVIDTLGQAVQQNCHDVVAVEREDLLKRLREAALAGKLDETLATLKTTVKSLGKVNFSDATPEEASLTAVQANWPPDFGKVLSSIVVSGATDAAAASYPPQSAAIIAALGGGGAPGLVNSSTAMSGCPAMTIVAGNVERRNALLIYTSQEGGQHFIPAGAPVPTSPMEFRNNAPQGDALKNYIAGLAVDQRVLGVTLATPKAAPDAGAKTRLKAVLKALEVAGRPLAGAARQGVEALSANDRTRLVAAGFQPNDFDDVVFFERT